MHFDQPLFSAFFGSPRVDRAKTQRFGDLRSIAIALIFGVGLSGASGIAVPSRLIREGE